MICVGWTRDEGDGAFERRPVVYCGTRRKRVPTDGPWSVPTLCGRYVMLPGDYSEQEPTCPDCLEKMGDDR